MNTVKNRSENPNENENPNEKNTPNHTIKQLGNDEIERIFSTIRNRESGNKDVFGFLTDIVEHTHKLIKKEKMGNEYIDKHLGKLSARELLSHGKTFYMNPCLDFVLVTIEGLKKTGEKDIKFVVEELECSGKNQFKLHFGIETTINDEIYHIDYRSKNTVIIGTGRFESDYSDKGERVINTIHVPAEEISADDNIYTLIEKKLVSLKFFNMNVFEILKEKLKSDNNDEQREKGFVEQVRDIHKPEIVIKRNNDQSTE